MIKAPDIEGEYSFSYRIACDEVTHDSEKIPVVVEKSSQSLPANVAGQASS